jgi:hypothetical protein
MNTPARFLSNSFTVLGLFNPLRTLLIGIIHRWHWASMEHIQKVKVNKAQEKKLVCILIHLDKRKLVTDSHFSEHRSSESTLWYHG